MKCKVLLLTVCTLLYSVVLTSCKDSKVDDVAKDLEIVSEPAGSDGNDMSPIGLTYHCFSSDNDVEILNPDTTEIAVSKELAERLNITAFKGRTMGIWQKINQMPYIRKVLNEELVEDRYILEVERGTVADVLGECNAELCTEMFVDKENQASLRSADATVDDVRRFVSKYTDKDNVTHPAAVLLTDPYGYDKPFVYADELDETPQKRASADGYMYYTPENLLGLEGGLGSSGKILSVYTELERKFYIPVMGDSLTLWITCPLVFELNYRLSFNTYMKHQFLFVYTPKLRDFNAGVYGKVEFEPQVTFGYQVKKTPPPGKSNIPIARFNGYTFVFMVGPIPIPMTVTPTLDFSFYYKLSGKVYSRLRYEYKETYDVGVTYNEKSGWDSYNNTKVLKNRTKWYPVKADFRAMASTGFLLGAEVLVGGCAGPQMSIGPTLFFDGKFSIDPTDDKWYSYRADLDFGIYAMLRAKLTILGYTITEWNTYAQVGPTLKLFHLNSEDSDFKSEDMEFLDDLPH